MVRMILAVLAASVVFAGPAQAQQVSAATPASIVQALQGAGYKADLGKDGTGDPVISSSSSGTGFAIYFYGCAKAVACKTVQFSANYENVTPPATLARINEWNRDNRWGHAYLTDTNTLRIQMDVDLEQGGISKALFVDNLEYWVAVMASFEKFIAGK